MSILKVKSGTNAKTEKLKNNIINPKNLTPLNLLIDRKLHKQFKIKTCIENTSMTDILVEAIKNYLKQ